MLQHWYELFPEPQSSRKALQHLSPEQINARLAKVPSSWTRLLRELCTADEDDDIADDFLWGLFSALEDGVRDASAKLWQSVWRTGFVLTLAELIDSAFLCGYTRQQIVSECGMCLERVSLMLDVLLACTERIVEDDRPAEVKQLLDIMQGTIIRVFVKLWDVKDPFLISEFLYSERAAGGLMLYDTDLLFRTLVQLGYLTATQLDEHRTINFADSCIPHLFLLVWIWSSDLTTRSDAIANLGLVPRTDSAGTRDAVWARFFAAAAHDCCDSDAIRAAARRDLADEQVADDALAHTAIVALMWHHHVRATGATLHDDAALARACLAAARRQLCRGHDTKADDTALLGVVSATFKNIILGLPLRGNDCYAYLDLLSQYVLLRLDAPEPALPDILTKCLTYALPPLRTRASHTSPRSTALRLHSAGAWRFVGDALARRRVAARGAAWRRFVVAWGALRPLLALPDDRREGGEVPAVAYGALARCAWGACLCSRHAPAHRMRVCSGCGRVAYCGGVCQEMDWKQGGHREVCRGRGGGARA
ncbi:zinc finger MYND domain-containing protein [Phanerochaete sordida]|uniref:Zinc finger MYND domain-containing protein n=1 Tax=Phanerochaete sordida TaxID=48140 RepID=A0A9P3LFA7_9APHY|nr:zinc finger MYND domain-containing protein [Phanerochaete sordida]